jgi:hypothetical protein
MGGKKEQFSRWWVKGIVYVMSERLFLQDNGLESV